MSVLLVGLIVSGGAPTAVAQNATLQNATLQNATLQDATPQEAAAPDTLTFADALERFLANDPVLRAARAASDARALEAEAGARFPNPSLTVQEERTNLEGDGVDDQWFATVTQPLLYPGEHRARRRAARAGGRAAEADLQEARAEAFAQIRHRYLDVVTAQQRLDVRRRVAAAVRAGADAAAIRAEEGDLGLLARRRWDAARATAEDDQARAEEALAVARTRLQARLHPSSDGLRAGASMESVVVGRPVYRVVQVDVDGALRQAHERRGMLASASAAVQQREYDLSARRYGRYPDLALSAGPKRQSIPAADTYGYTAGVQIGLPLWDGGRAQVEAARNRRNAAAADLDAARRQVTMELQTAVQRLRSAQARIERVGPMDSVPVDSLIHDAQFVYREGELSLFELLDAIDAAQAAALLRIDGMDAYLRALYDLEAAVGIRPTDPPLVLRGALQPVGRP